MGDYTKSVKELVYQYGTGDTLREKITSSLPYIFDFEFPIFDENYRSVLETKIIKRYFTREICEVDEELWKLRFDSVMNEIMPYYNQFYSSATIEINPLYNYSLKRDHNLDGGGSKSTTGTSSKVSTSTSDAQVSSKVTDEHNLSHATNQQSADTEKNNSTDSSSTNESRLSSGSSKAKTDEKSDTTSKTDGSTSSIVKESDTPMGGIENLEDGYLTKATQEKGTSKSDGTTNVVHTVDVTTENDAEDSVNSNTSHTISGNASKNSTVILTGQDNYNGENNVSSDEKKTSSASDNTQNDNNEVYTSTEQFIENVTGTSGISQSKLLQEYRETFLNIDEEIIDRLSNLFVLVW